MKYCAAALLIVTSMTWISCPDLHATLHGDHGTGLRTDFPGPRLSIRRLPAEESTARGTINSVPRFHQVEIVIRSETVRPVDQCKNIDAVQGPAVW